MELTSFAPSPDDVEARAPASGLELTVYFHSAKRSGRHLLADELMSRCAELGVPACALLAGTEGFGDARRVRAETSEGAIPLIATTTLAEPSSALLELASGSFATLADVTLLDAGGEALRARAEQPVELVIHCRIGADRADPAGLGGVIAHLRRHGVARAIAVSGGDGVVNHQRLRDRMLAHSAAAPALVVAVDRARVLAAAVPALLASPQVDLISAKPVWIWKDGGTLTPTPITEDVAGWRKLSVYTTEDALAVRPRQTLLVGRLRNARAAGATVVRGRLGYTLGQPLQPQLRWFGRRDAPLVTTIVDDRDQIARWFEIVDELTGDDDLVTCGTVRVA